MALRITDSLSGAIKVNYTPTYKQRAEQFQTIFLKATQFYEQRYHSTFNYRMAVLNEDILHHGYPSYKINLSKDMSNNRALIQWIEFHFIGVVNHEWTIYNRSIMPRRFVTFLFIDSTTALHTILPTAMVNK